MLFIKCRTYYDGDTPVTEAEENITFEQVAKCFLTGDLCLVMYESYNSLEDPPYLMSEPLQSVYVLDNGVYEIATPRYVVFGGRAQDRFSTAGAGGD